jgi:hypothetical protein
MQESNPDGPAKKIVKKLNKHNKILLQLADQYSNAINHVGISVTDLKKAKEFYTKTFGFKVLKQGEIIVDGSSTTASIFKDIFKDHLKKVRAAWLESGNGVGLEIFEFVNPKAEKPTDLLRIRRSVFLTFALPITRLMNYVTKSKTMEVESIAKSTFLVRVKSID